MKKFLILLLSLTIFLSFSITSFGAGSGGGSDGGGIGGGSNIDPVLYSGYYKWDLSPNFNNYITEYTVLTFPFYSSGNELFNKLIIDPDDQSISYKYDDGTTSKPLQVAYFNSSWVRESLQYFYIPNDIELTTAQRNFLAWDSYNDGYLYNNLLLYSTSDSYFNESASKPYWFIYHNPSSEVSYLYKSSSPIYYDSSLGKYRYSGASYVETYNLTYDSLTIVESINVEKDSAITANTSSLVWSSLDIYNESNKLYFTGDSYYKEIYSGDIGGAGDIIGGGTNSGDTDNNESWFSSFLTGLKNIWDSILNLPARLVSGFGALLRDIFVPDSDYIETAFNSFTAELKTKFNIDTTAFESLFSEEQPVEDIYVDYSISGVGDFNFKVFDSSFFKQGVEYFRPIIRGFLVLLLLFYNIKQLIGFFGYDAGVVAGRQDSIAESKKIQREGD